MLKRETGPGLLASFSLEEQETPYGKFRQFQLSDGTQVWLNAGSTFKHPANFHDAKLREVYLEGEAFFDVGSGYVGRGDDADRSLAVAEIEGRLKLPSQALARSG